MCCRAFGYQRRGSGHEGCAHRVGGRGHPRTCPEVIHADGVLNARLKVGSKRHRMDLGRRGSVQTWDVVAVGRLVADDDVDVGPGPVLSVFTGIPSSGCK